LSPSKWPFLARFTPTGVSSYDFPLFGYGDDRIEAVEALKSEIESLYFDLMEDDNFTEDWQGLKEFFKHQVIDS
jgi:hypothetical protein